MNTETATTTKNAFVDAVDFRGAMGKTENGATTNLSSGSVMVDQFGKAGNFRGRSIDDVFYDQALIWEENADAALRFPFYLRMITRKVKVNKKNETDKVQSGQGARDESFKRLLWVAKEHAESFNKNAWLIPLVGSWKDMWTLMFYDIKEKLNVLDQKMIFNILMQGLSCDAHVDLVKKFMPRIKSKSKCTTEWTQVTNSLAKAFAKYMGLDYKSYNKLKTSGKAHDFQKLICARDYEKINWNLVPGRALNLLVHSKFLKNHSLTDEYRKWIEGKPVAKYTGYVFELAKQLRPYCRAGNKYISKSLPIELRHTLDAQFMGLVETARANGKINENVWCALDTSGSMGRNVMGLKDVTCEDIASSLTLFFAELNQGAFHNKIIMFDNTSYPYDIKEKGFCDRVANLPSVPCGGTNFQSIVEEIVKIRETNPNIPLEDYPKTILVVSDMQFNPVGPSWFSRGRTETNYEHSKDTLKKVFPAEFVDSMKFIWWDCASRQEHDFAATINDGGCYFFSGFDGSIISLLLNEEVIKDEKSGEVRRPTAEEIVIKALSQEILNYIIL